MKKAITQLQTIRKHLNKGKSITALQALKLCGTMRLAHHIFILRKEMEIMTTYIKTNGAAFAKYSKVKK